MWPRRSSWATSRRGGAFGVAALEVVAAEVAVGLAGAENVPGGGHDRVPDGDDGAGGAAAHAQPVIVGLQVAALGARGGVRRFTQRGAQPFGALAGLAG